MQEPEMFGFTPQHVRTLTGLSLGQLSYWNKLGFFTPQYVNKERRTFGRIYSFRDVVGLRALGRLRKQYKISLQELRKVGEYLSARYSQPWSCLTFYVVGRSVYFDDPITGTRMASKPGGQTVIPFAMERIVADAAKEAAQLRRRTEDQIGITTRNRYVVHNAVVVAGTRIPTCAIWNLHKAGYSVEEIISEYPTIHPQDVEASLAREEELRRRAV